MRRRLAATTLAVVTALGLAACGDGDDAEGTPSSTAEPSDAASADVVDGPLPEVTGAFGEDPEIAVSTEQPSDKLAVKVLSEGDGPNVESAQLLVANYAGQTWDDGKVFDSSFERDHPEGFPIGVGSVVKGWDQGLVGLPLGSRVVLSIPPALGYGEAGRAPDIAGDDTLVFVVDLIAAYDGTQSAEGTAVTDLPEGFPTATDAGEGQPPKVTVPAGASAPSQPVARRVVSGNGDPLDLSYRIVVQAHQVAWEGGAQTGTTWGATPATLDPKQVPGLVEQLEGARAGSRVVVALPAGLSGEEAGVLVLDVLGSY